MQECLSGILAITPAQISIKATTKEKMGFVGEERGIEAYAVALIYIS
jgi:2-C-methyl-D-erythritol 2,4-cyclodiphosphate synthase